MRSIALYSGGRSDRRAPSPQPQAGWASAHFGRRPDLVVRPGVDHSPKFNTLWTSFQVAFRLASPVREFQ